MEDSATLPRVWEHVDSLPANRWELSTSLKHLTTSLQKAEGRIQLILSISDEDPVKI